MFQSFKASTTPTDGPPRLSALRAEMERQGVDAFLVPRSDKHQGEWVPARDERLAWLTGFTGSAGFAAVTQNQAGVFIDGRYRIQVKDQIDTGVFTPVHWPETDLGDWLSEHLKAGAKVAYDPWLHVSDQVAKLEARLAQDGISLIPSDNLVDAIWADQPAPPFGKIDIHPLEFAGETSEIKRQKLAQTLQNNGQRSAVLTAPDSIAWLLNIRGSDIARTPVALLFAVLHDDASLHLLADEKRIDSALAAHLGADVTILPEEGFAAFLGTLNGVVRVDKSSAPQQISAILASAGIEIAAAADPCALPKACKNPVEIEGTRQAHLRDAVAVAELLAWLDNQGPAPDLTEIDVVTKLEALRRQSNHLVDISFETICGTGPNGAINHYRVTEESNRRIQSGDLLLVDSGGQYRDGTTDITRTIAIGAPTDEHRACFTRVLKGVIAISQLRWPKGLAGRDLDPFARAALWAAGQDFDHGTGHGVGSFLGVHEGPQRLSRLSTVPFQPGMILSNEPGYYREGDFGIRIENLVVVQNAAELPGADAREMLAFETITFAPIDRNLIDLNLLSDGERDWIDRYHGEILDKVAPQCSPATQEFLARACAAL